MLFRALSRATLTHCRFYSAKLSMWYAVGLLARGTPQDVERANLLLNNAMTMQDLEPAFEQNYGS